LWGSDAGEWKPERWMNDLAQSRLEANIPGIYSHILTFAGRGRLCVEVKFAQIEMKFMAFDLLNRLRFSLGKQKIIWKFGGVVTPGVSLDNVRPELPLVVKQAD
ncbi:hypothetical protein BKA70DRAFT_1088241, partial [Coprinopsis sp. MPI-PUGE-AT-0042]